MKHRTPQEQGRDYDAELAARYGGTAQPGSGAGPQEGVIQEIPLGLCQCGCGQETKISPYTDRPRGYFKGVPRRYARGHKGSKPLETRIWDHVEKRGECLIWTGTTVGAGYGSIRRPKQGKLVLAHVAAWELVFGPVPPGKELHHTCLEPACVNTDHLTPLTRSEHKAVHFALRPTCKLGHQYDGERKTRDGRVVRCCLTCRRAKETRRRDRRLKRKVAK